MVRDEVWAEAMMDGWNSGFLCTPCLQKRLDRELADDDFDVRAVGATNNGLDSLTSSEYMERVSRGRG